MQTLRGANFSVTSTVKSNKSLAEQATGGLLQLPLDPAQQPEQLAPTSASIQEANQLFESFLLLSHNQIRSLL